MRLVKKANGYSVKMTRQEWEDIGRNNLWLSSVKFAQEAPTVNVDPNGQNMAAQVGTQNQQQNKAIEMQDQQVLLQIQQALQQMTNNFQQYLRTGTNSLEQSLTQVNALVNNSLNSLKNVNQ